MREAEERNEVAACWSSEAERSRTLGRSSERRMWIASRGRLWEGLVTRKTTTRTGTHPSRHDETCDNSTGSAPTPSSVQRNQTHPSLRRHKPILTHKRLPTLLLSAQFPHRNRRN